MIELLIDQRRRNLGRFEVGRVLRLAKRRMVGPFIFFDHLGPADLPKGLAREADVRQFSEWQWITTQSQIPAYPF